ncbi:MAG TPA: hypothetical protein VK886_21955 [Vicinamibacterales bacterium]|nr:hypothetical protein [Vicinamibacterales bacterium]
MLSRIRRNTIVAAGAMVIAALALDPQRPRAAFGVLGGVLLVATSYVAIAFTIGVFIPERAQGATAEDPSTGKKTRQKALAVLVFAGHYALLGFAAYVMIARLRLHPIGLLGGVTSIVLAVAAEAIRPRPGTK